MLANEGSKIKHLEAQIFGGAYNHEVSVKNIGKDNIRIAKSILIKKQVRVVSEDTGGERGRKIVFNTTSGDVAVLKVQRIREEDWYPYKSNR